MNLVSSSRSDLYNFLANMGALSTEDTRIKQVRNSKDWYETLPLSYDDIQRVGYYYPHFVMNPKYKDKVELWYGDEYVNPSTIEWIETIDALYGVFKKKVDISIPVRMFYNSNIAYRYSNVVEDPDDNNMRYHTFTIDTSDIIYSKIDDFEKAVFYISESKFYQPEFEWIDDKRVQIRARYKRDIDLMICTNLVNIVQAKANTGTYIDYPHANICYHMIFVDNSSNYPIDARFYPCVMVDKDCIIRVYSDNYNEVMYPNELRLISYPEFADIDDPYNCDNEFLNSLEPVDDIIDSKDLEEDIIDKFSRIANWCYRIWEQFPKSSSEQSDFLVCDNTSISSSTFVVADVALKEEKVQKIISTVPYEENKDLLFYHGKLFSDYKVRRVKNINGSWVESNTGYNVYLIDPSYDPSEFSLVKFNTWEDTIVKNIGHYINEDNIARLYLKVNRFMRNLLVVRSQVLTSLGDEDKVRVMTNPPSAHDEHLWYELLVNAVPEYFQGDPIGEIKLQGLDPRQVPEDIRNGAYSLQLDSEEGPDSYTSILSTYVKLTKSKQKYLALQFDDEEDAGVKEYHSLDIGRTEPPDAEINDIRLESASDDDTVYDFEFGIPDNPGNGDEGDIYVDIEDEVEGLIDEIFGPDPKTILKSQIRELIGPAYAKFEYQINKLGVDKLTGVLRDIKTVKDSILNGEVRDTGLTPDEIRENNLTYIFSRWEPDDPHEGLLWINLPAVTLEDYIPDIISHCIRETSYDLPEAHDDTDMILDYGAHSTAGSGVGELFQEETDETLHKVVYGSEMPDISEMVDNDLWYEFIDSIDGRVCYSDSTSMVLRIDERLILVEFQGAEDVTAYAFDDILMNFKGRLGIKYMSILADLLNSGIIHLDEVNIFYKRLITAGDWFDPKLKRLYTGTSNVISTAAIDTTDYAIHYSSNVGRFTLDYSAKNVTNREREEAYRMIFNYKNRDFAFISDRMLMFVNGKFVPPEKLKEIELGRVQIQDFDEIIATIDIFYSKHDDLLMRIKKACIPAWPDIDSSEIVDKPSAYEVMEPMHLTDYTYRGFYDVLFHDYIFNGRLFRIMNYLEEHPEEADEFCRDLVRKFHAVSDIDLSGMPEDDSRIILFAGNDDYIYTLDHNVPDDTDGKNVRPLIS